MEAHAVTNEIKGVLGTCRTPVAAEGLTQAAPQAEVYPIITKRTAATVLATALARFEIALGGLDWLLARLKLLPAPGKQMACLYIIYLHIKYRICTDVPPKRS